MLIDIRHKEISIKNPRIGEFVIIVLEQARRNSVARFCNIWQEFLWWRDFGGHFAWIALKIESSRLPCILFRLENIAKKQHADVRAYPIDEHTIVMLNAPNNALIGEFIHEHPMGPIVWEQTWYEQDAYYCENNIITTNIVGCANNFSPITSATSREAAEEYLSEYMVKEKTNLKRAVPSLLGALD